MSDFIEIADEKVNSISPKQAWRYRILPKSDSPNEVTFFTDQFEDENLRNELSILFGKNILFEALETNTLNKTLGKYYRQTNSDVESLASVSGGTDNVILKVISEAKALGSSDIHIEYYQSKARVRYRIDGKLIHRFTIDQNSYKNITNQIKLKAGANLAEVRRPQDGRLDLREFGLDIDIRASILPVHGKHEKVVMRILESEAASVELSDLGFRPDQLKIYEQGVSKSNGIVLISGPTGSGKTTTLYATLKKLNTDNVNVMTVENPIEYVLEGINQVQVNEDIDFGFAEALKTFLRQDPDIIMVGEIRDRQTAEMAIRASLTGHLVLSTIHTNSAWGTISRLSDMGIPDYLIADTLNTSIAQRLVRLLCDNCKTPVDLDPKKLSDFGIDAKKIDQTYTSNGCENCHYTGYKGRKAVYEVIGLNEVLKESIKSRSFSPRVKLREMGISSLMDNAVELLKEGRTSYEEIYPLLLAF